LVKETLNYIIGLLGEHDRFCLIMFDFLGERLTPLKKVTQPNKEMFKQIFSKIIA